MTKFSKSVKENFLYKIVFSHHKYILNIFIIISLFTLSTHVFSADTTSGADILAGTADGLKATLNGTGKTYLYIAEGVLSLAAYIKTKNLLFLAGIVVVACFFNIMMKVAAI